MEVADDLEAAVRSAWMVVEAAPEKLELKREVLAELDRLADPDAIVASNSSSLRPLAISMPLSCLLSWQTGGMTPIIRTVFWSRC